MAFIDSGQTFDKKKHRDKMKKTMENMEITKVTARVPTHIFRKFRKKLLENRTSANAFINLMILNLIRK